MDTVKNEIAEAPNPTPTEASKSFIRRWTAASLKVDNGMFTGPIGMASIFGSLGGVGYGAFEAVQGVGQALQGNYAEAAQSALRSVASIGVGLGSAYVSTEMTAGSNDAGADLINRGK
jgi:hypothetical protein